MTINRYTITRRLRKIRACLSKPLDAPGSCLRTFPEKRFFRSIRYSQLRETNRRRSEKGNSYRHLVPYKHILDAFMNKIQGALPDPCLSFYTCASLLMKPEENISALGIARNPRHPRDVSQFSRVDFESDVESAIEAICDHRDKIYYGKGTGDKNGTAVDMPDGVNAKVEYAQVRARVRTLKRYLPHLNIEWMISANSYV